MSDKVYSLQDLFDELKPPYADQAHLANMLNTLAYLFGRPWREETPAATLIDGFTPILGEYLELPEDTRYELLGCLCYLFDPYADENLDLDISVIKDNLQILEPSGLACALSVIADERAWDAEDRIRPYLTHETDWVREAAQEELDELVAIREFQRRRSDGGA